MPESNELRDKILSMFVSVDDLRPELHTPWNSVGYVGATNGHVMVLLVGEDARYAQIKVGKPDVSYLFPKRDGSRHVSALKLQAMLDSLPTVPAKEKVIDECPECNGTGECTCMTCDADHECGFCSGEGKCEQEVDSPTVRVFDDVGPVQIGEIAYASRYVKLLVEVAAILGTDTILSVSPEEPLHGQEFLIGDTRLLIMPMRPTEGEKPPCVGFEVLAS